MYIVREAHIKDKENILEFIKEKWNENHIFVKDKSLFDYYHVNNEELNFIIAEENKRIIATLGYLKYNSSKYNETSDVFTVIWKSCDNSMAGIKCLKYLMNKGYKSISSCGINKKTETIYKFLGYKTGKLNHWYILNDTLKNEDYKIAKIKSTINKTIYNYYNNKEVFLNKDIKEQEFNSIKQNNFVKSYKDFFHKYIKHPYYEYKIYSIEDKDEIKCLMITREISINDNKCLRIVDLIGESLYLVNISLQKILQENNYEYIDFYEFGVDKNLLQEIGLTLRIDTDENVIPNYFEPFEQSNIDIYYTTNCGEDFCMFKGDGDQDRPSIAKEKLNE